MFRTMFDRNNMDYIVEHIEFTKIMHPSREPPKRSEIHQGLCKNIANICHCMLVSNSETVKYIHKVGEI